MKRNLNPYKRYNTDRQKRINNLWLLLYAFIGLSGTVGVLLALNGIFN